MRSDASYKLLIRRVIMFSNLLVFSLLVDYFLFFFAVYDLQSKYIILKLFSKKKKEEFLFGILSRLYTSHHEVSPVIYICLYVPKLRAGRTQRYAARPPRCSNRKYVILKNAKTFVIFWTIFNVQELLHQS